MIAENTQQEVKIQDYKSIDKIIVSNTVLKGLIKFCKNSTNNQIEGMLFGHEEDHEIKIETAIPVSNTIIYDSSALIV